MKYTQLFTNKNKIMLIKTIAKVIAKKLEDWLETITDENLRKEVRKSLLVSGGSITSLLLNEKVNDYDVYIQDMDVLIKLANYYCPGQVLDGRKKQEYLSQSQDTVFNNDNETDNLAQQRVRYLSLKDNQVKLNVASDGVRMQPAGPDEKYTVAFLSQNAISLNDDVQIVLRFNGTPQEIHETFDFIHATNYFTFADGLVTNVKALECVITKELKYQGSHYPLTSIIRMKKFIRRNWKINAGEILKIMFQISELDLKDVVVLEEQLIGVDIAYFSTLIEIIRGVPPEKLCSSYLNELIDRVFNQYDDPEENDSNY